MLGRQVLRDHSALRHPFALTVFGSHLYWTDWRTNGVVRANKWNGSDVSVVQRTLTQPFDLKVRVRPHRAIARCARCGSRHDDASRVPR